METIPDVRTMEAGRKMDLLVEDLVMGRCVCVHDPEWFTKARSGSSAYVNQDGWRCVTHDRPIGSRGLPSFSTDIAAAWDVLEAMIRHGYFPNLEYTHGGWRVGMGLSWQVGGVGTDGKEEMVPIRHTAETIPLAICRAALLAMS